MSEPTPYLPSALEDERPQQVWIIQPPRQRWWVYVLFFALTMLSTLVVGARMQFNFMHGQPVFSLNDDTVSLFPLGWVLQQPSNLLLGLPFSLTLMFILFAHEMGHYLYARHYRVYATPPFFVPFPSLIGTLGAFIRIKSPIPSRAALFDIGIAGPIAGFIPACGALLVGLSLSRPVMGPPASGFQLGFPLAFHLAARFLQKISQEVRNITRGEGVDIVIEHVGAATWDESVRSLKPGGTLVTCGATTGPKVDLELRFLFSRQLSLLGSYMGTMSELYEVLGHVFAGRLKPVIDRVFPMKDIRAAHEYMEKSQMFGKIVLTP